jgi:hypothetical protein
MTTSGQKVFTISEARELLPDLRPRLLRMREVWKKMSPFREESKRLSKKMEDGGSTMPNAGEYFQQIRKLQKELAFFETSGIQVKDISSGLVDFPSLRNGRVVYLCWRMDEPSITHWHETNEGFAGRQPLEDNWS